MHFPSRSRLALLESIIALVLLAGCSRPPAAKRYELQGRVVAVDPAAHTLTVAHQDVPGLMKGMTMPFPGAWKRLGLPCDCAWRPHSNTLVLSDHAELQDISFTKSSASAVDGTSALHIPQPGELVPNFALVNQDGRSIHLQQFQGKPLLLTFVYTRCPFPDYCLRMSSNFSQILQQLAKQPQVFARTQLLSISIDPKDDTPAVMRNYGARYVGQTDPNFRHWEFATGSPEQVRQAADFFGLVSTRKTARSCTASVRF